MLEGKILMEKQTAGKRRESDDSIVHVEVHEVPQRSGKVSDEDIQRIIGDVEPIDLNRGRSEIKETTWHRRGVADNALV